MKRRAFFSTLTAAGLSIALRPAFSVVAQRKTKNPNLDLENMLSVTEVPGISGAGHINGKTLEFAAGVRSVSDRASVTAATVFSAASLSKPVFAWAVRDLVKQGKLEWSKPLQDYVDLGLKGDARLITAEHVLSHRTGLPNWRFQPNLELATTFSPGARWQYSGEGFFLLQRVVENAVGKPIAAYMKDSVLMPFGMTASSYAWTPELQTKAASGHDRRANLLERSAAYYEKRNYDVLEKAGLQPESASYPQIVEAYQKANTPVLHVSMTPNMAGSLWTTAPDYLKFLKRVSADITKDPENYRTLVDVNPRLSWTRGWGVDRSLRSTAFFHWGDGPGFKTFAWIQPETDTTLAVFTNGDHGMPLYSSVFRKLIAADPAVLYWL